MVLLNLVTDTSLPCPITTITETAKSDEALNLNYYNSCRQEEYDLQNENSSNAAAVSVIRPQQDKTISPSHQLNLSMQGQSNSHAGIASSTQDRPKVLRPKLDFKKEPANTSSNCGVVSSSSSYSSSSSSSSLTGKSPGKATILDRSSEFLSYWGTSYQANDPCEDRYCSLANVLLSSDTSQKEESCPYPSLRMSLFAVLDGHGGPAVAEYASRHLLPLLARDISNALSCPIVDSGVFQINGKRQSVDLEQNSLNHTNDEDGNDDDDSLLLDREPHFHSDVESDSDSDSDSEASSGSSRGCVQPDTSKWYTAPENDENSAFWSFSDTSTTGPDFVPGTHSEHEQRLISATVQKSFLKLDEQWINSIDPFATKQSFVVHNGKWNSGACCLVNIVLQRIIHNREDDDDHDDNDDDSVKLSDHDKLPKAILYSCHTGDCRSVVFSSLEENEDENRSIHSAGQSDHDIFYQCSDSDSDSDSDVENGHEVYVNGVTLSRKRMFLNPFHNRCSPPMKRQKLFDEEKPIKVQEDPQSQRKMSWESSDSLSSCARLVSTSRSPSPLDNITPFPSALLPTTLTKDHTPYNQKEASLVRERCNYAPRAIATSTNGGIQRVAGSLSVTRALGDAYLKTPTLSFSPYKAHAPYISALPEVSARILSKKDRLLVLASDGVWERVSGEEIAKWMVEFFKRQDQQLPTLQSPLVSRPPTPCSVDRNRSRRMRMLPTRKSLSAIEDEVLNARILNMAYVSDMIVSNVLNIVRRKHKIPDIETLMGLPKGHSRRSKHDDITTLVVDLEGFTM